MNLRMIFVYNYDHEMCEYIVGCNICPRNYFGFECREFLCWKLLESAFSKTTLPYFPEPILTSGFNWGRFLH